MRGILSEHGCFFFFSTLQKHGPLVECFDSVWLSVWEQEHLAEILCTFSFIQSSRSFTCFNPACCVLPMYKCMCTFCNQSVLKKPSSTKGLSFKSWKCINRMLFAHCTKLCYSLPVLKETCYAFWYFLKVKMLTTQQQLLFSYLSPVIWKHFSWNDLSVVLPLTPWLCDITLCHHVTCLNNLCLSS